jgi:hypothetical protein
MSRNRDAFALVELLVGLVALAIVAALVIVVMNSVGYDGSAETCRKEALEFEAAVRRYYELEKKWPAGGDTNSVAVVAGRLKTSGVLVADVATATAHLDGSQRVITDDSTGWMYDFNTHTTDDTRCG